MDCHLLNLFRLEMSHLLFFYSTTRLVFVVFVVFVVFSDLFFLFFFCFVKYTISFFPVRSWWCACLSSHSTHFRSELQAGTSWCRPSSWSFFFLQAGSRGSRPGSRGSAGSRFPRPAGSPCAALPVLTRLNSHHRGENFCFI